MPSQILDHVEKIVAAARQLGRDFVTKKQNKGALDAVDLWLRADAAVGSAEGLSKRIAASPTDPASPLNPCIEDAAVTPGVASDTSKIPVNLAVKPWTSEVRLLKNETEKPEVIEERFVLGIVLEPETIDAQNDIYSDKEIRKAAHGFMEYYGHIGLMHKQLVDDRIKILESYLSPMDFAIGDQLVKRGTWLLGARIVDDVLWEKVKKGEFTGWSIGGSAIKEPDKNYNLLISAFAA